MGFGIHEMIRDVALLVASKKQRLQGCFPVESPVVTVLGWTRLRSLDTRVPLLSYDVDNEKLQQAFIKGKIHSSSSEFVCIQFDNGE